MSKRPSIDLMALTAESAAPMTEATQRAPAPAAAKSPVALATTPTANLEALAFKVSPAFRRRFRQRAVAADMKLNELLFAALDAWEREQGLES